MRLKFRPYLKRTESFSMARRLAAEFIGTLWLVLGGCGSAVLAAAFPDLGIGFVGVSLAFGLTVLTMAYAVGHVSGCHLNPAVSVGLCVGGRFPVKDLIPYIVVQVLGESPSPQFFMVSPADMRVSM
jgi:aquaporin Z